jgi:hypothetical protein
MTTHTLARYRDHTVIGAPDQLANLLANHRTAGTLIAATAPRLAADGRYRIRVRLRDTAAPAATGLPIQVISVDQPVTSRARPRTRLTRRAVAMAVTVTVTVTGVTAGVLTGVAYLMGELVKFIAAHAGLIVGVLAVIAVIAAFLVHINGSGRRHCPGC